MKKLAFSLIFIASYLVASITTINPAKEIEADGIVNDIVLSNNSLLMGTDHGSLQVADLKTFKVKTLFHLPKIKDFMGDPIDDKVFSVDEFDGRFLILSDSGVGGFSDLRIMEGTKITQLINADDRQNIIKARFISKDRILYATLGNEAVLYDIKAKKEIYRKQINESKFSSFALDSKRQRAVFGGESGELTLIDTASGKILKRVNNIHVDNIFSVAICKDWIIAGGQDRRASYFNISTGEHGYFKSNFLVYAVALSPSAHLGAYAMHDDNTITIYNLANKTESYLLKGQKSILSRIIFADEDTLFSASHDSTVMMWKLK